MSVVSWLVADRARLTEFITVDSKIDMVLLQQITEQCTVEESSETLLYQLNRFISETPEFWKLPTLVVENFFLAHPLLSHVMVCVDIDFQYVRFLKDLTSEQVDVQAPKLGRAGVAKLVEKYGVECDAKFLLDLVVKNTAHDTSLFAMFSHLCESNLIASYQQVNQFLWKLSPLSNPNQVEVERALVNLVDLPFSLFENVDPLQLGLEDMFSFLVSKYVDETVLEKVLSWLYRVGFDDTDFLELESFSFSAASFYRHRFLWDFYTFQHVDELLADKILTHIRLDDVLVNGSRVKSFSRILTNASSEVAVGKLKSCTSQQLYSLTDNSVAAIVYAHDTQVRSWLLSLTSWDDTHVKFVLEMLKSFDISLLLERFPMRMWRDVKNQDVDIELIDSCIVQHLRRIGTDFGSPGLSVASAFLQSSTSPVVSLYDLTAAALA